MSQPPTNPSRQATARGRVGLAQTMTPGGRARNQSGNDDSADRPSRTRIRAPDDTSSPSQQTLEAAGGMPMTRPVIHKRSRGLLYRSQHHQGSGTDQSSHEQLHRDRPEWDNSYYHGSTLSRDQLASTSGPLVNKTSLVLVSKKEPTHHFYHTPTPVASTPRRHPGGPSTGRVTHGQTSARGLQSPTPAELASPRLVDRRHALVEEELLAEEKKYFVPRALQSPTPAELASPRLVDRRPALVEEQLMTDERMFLLETRIQPKSGVDTPLRTQEKMFLLENGNHPRRDISPGVRREEGVVVSTHDTPESQAAARHGGISPVGTVYDEDEVVIVDFEIEQDEAANRAPKYPPRTSKPSWGSVARLMTSKINTGHREDAWGRSRGVGAPTGGPGGGSLRPGVGAPPTASAIKRMRQQTEGKNLNRCQIWRQKWKFWWKRKRNRHKESPVFRDQIRNVEGRFGSGVAAFLLFVRHLLLLDVVLAIMWLLLVILPQAIYIDYTPIAADFYIRNLLDGGDGLAKSWWFYGNYDQEVGPGYPVGLFYLLATLLTYFGGLFVVFRSTAQAVEEEGGAAIKDTRYTFCRYVLTSWDYALTSKEAVHGLSRNIASLFRDHMSEIKTQQGEDLLNRPQRMRLIARRVGVWILTLLLISLGCTAIVFATSSSFLSEILIKMGYQAAEIEDNVVMVFGPTAVFMLVNAIVPLCIYRLPKLEKYSHPKTELHISIGRVFVLHMANLMSLVVSTYSNVGQTKGRDLCPGTLIGQELYKLVMLDTIVGVVTQSIPALAYFYWTGKKQEFDMASSVLTVIERQALIWLGTLVCPVMPLLGVVTMTSIFLTYYFVITLTCCPPSRRWNQPRRNSFLMGLTVVTLLLLLGPVSIAITRVDVINLGQLSDGGATCGPFGNQSMTHLVVEYSTTQGTWLAELLEVGLSPTLLLPAILLMMAIIYYQSMRVRWEKRKKKMLAAELMNEREESKDLTKRLHGLLT